MPRCALPSFQWSREYPEPAWFRARRPTLGPVAVPTPCPAGNSADASALRDESKCAEEPRLQSADAQERWRVAALAIHPRFRYCLVCHGARSRLVDPVEYGFWLAPARAFHAAAAAVGRPSPARAAEPIHGPPAAPFGPPVPGGGADRSRPRWTAPAKPLALHQRQAGRANQRPGRARARAEPGRRSSLNVGAVWLPPQKVRVPARGLWPSPVRAVPSGALGRPERVPSRR